jgi:hypothetical protein
MVQATSFEKKSEFKKILKKCLDVHLAEENFYKIIVDIFITVTIIFFRLQ